MKITKLFPVVIFLLIVQAGFSQQLYKCNESKSFWLIEKDGSFFTLRIPGKVKETERKNVLAVDSFALQYMMVEKKHYIEDDTADMKPLIKYALNETEYFSGMYNQKVNTNFEKAPIPYHDVLIWYFELPEHVSQGVKNQVFASIIGRDKIFSLSAPQFPEQDIEDVKNLLIEVIVTLKRDKAKPDAVKLCEEK